MTKLYILDASAVLALLHKEEGSEKVLQVLSRALISAVNYSEVVAKLAHKGMPENIISTVMGNLALNVCDFDTKQAVIAGLLLPETKRNGLSLGDRACLALAKSESGIALTADKIWKNLKNINIEIQLIR